MTSEPKAVRVALHRQQWETWSFREARWQRNLFCALMDIQLTLSLPVAIYLQAVEE